MQGAQVWPVVRELDTTCRKKDQRFCMTQLRPGAAKHIYVIQLHHIQITTIYSPPVQFSSVQSLSRVRLCDPVNLSTPGLPVHHQLPEFPQTHVHRVSDAIQPSHPLSSLSPPAPNPSQHQSLFQWVNSSHEVAKAPQPPHNSILMTEFNEHIFSLASLFVCLFVFLGKLLLKCWERPRARSGEQRMR